MHSNHKDCILYQYVANNHQYVLERIEELMDKEELSSTEEYELDVLANFVTLYEQDEFPIGE